MQDESRSFRGPDGSGRGDWKTKAHHTLREPNWTLASGPMALPNC